ncbi:MAG: hypothetical protein U0802_19715 [Candidatus Binatia bacterium]
MALGVCPAVAGTLGERPTIAVTVAGTRVLLGTREARRCADQAAAATAAAEAISSASSAIGNHASCADRSIAIIVTPSGVQGIATGLPSRAR